MKTSSSKPGSKDPDKTPHIPARTCIACRTTGAKRELLRVVRTKEGVVLDPTSKKSGRGAYLCPSYECWEAGIKGNKLEHALHTKLESDERKALEEYGKSLPRK